MDSLPGIHRRVGQQGLNVLGSLFPPAGAVANELLVKAVKKSQHLLFGRFCRLMCLKGFGGRLELTHTLDLGVDTQLVKGVGVMLRLHLETQYLGGPLGVDHHIGAGAGEVPADIGVGLGPRGAGLAGRLQLFERTSDFLGTGKAETR